jgi:two-component system response regulator VanR
LIVEDEPYLAEGIRDGLRLEAIAADGGVVSAEELLERAWDENADPFTNAVRITVSALRQRLGEPGIIATVAGVGYRIDAGPGTGREGTDRG